MKRDMKIRPIKNTLVRAAENGFAKPRVDIAIIMSKI